MAGLCEGGNEPAGSLKASKVEQVNAFTYLGCNLSYIHSPDIDNKLAKFQQLLTTIEEFAGRRAYTSIWRIEIYAI
ncbi:hypothetical protein ANN_14325 [Periplaneta americana]|uniref:Uncharacterized protein n=1 Tax=Periplaneta americana TaxID=6978 RepID=A0ABQ8SXF0_PERAM|nr:hypothetical protein ANN_14325 [Periplaneta americana]